MNSNTFRQLSRSLVARLVAGTLVPALALVPVPVSAAAGARAPSQAAPAVKVNRTVPKVRPVPLRPVLSAEPSDQELFKARIFEEPFVPVGGPSTPDDNRRLGQAIQAFVEAGDRLDLGPFERFLWDNDSSPWRASLLVGMGAAYLNAGRFTRAVRSWQEAWNLSKGEDDQRSRAIADRALGELARLRALHGQVTEAELLLREAEGRRMRGSAVEKLNDARAQLVAVREHPDLIHPTGALSIARVLASRSTNDQTLDPRLESFRAPQYGSTLTQVESLAKQVGLDMQMAYHADKSAPFEVPSVAHLSIGHYAALVARNEAGTRYLLEDAAYGKPLWVTREALLEESSGYFLIESDKLSAAWRPVERASGDRVLGRCLGKANANNTTPNDHKEGDCDCSKGMATYRFHAVAVSLNITDTPVGYSPPRGPGVSFSVTYNHKEAGQPSTFSYSNLGPRWTFDQLSFIEDENLQALVLHVRGGGMETYTDFDGQSTGPHYMSQNQLVRVSTNPVVWEVRRADGSADTYSQLDCELCSGRRVFLTRSEDAQGDAVTYTYDENLRIVAITDAIGQVTTVSHDLAADSYKVTRVTDPFGRFAQFEYDAVGNLIRITDVLGLTSEFGYDSTEAVRADFITSLTTPYGTTTFRQAESGYSSLLEATDPLGGTERIAYDAVDSQVPAEQRHPPQDDPAVVPFGFAEYNASLNMGLTHYWDKRAMALHSGDYRWAKATRWLTDTLVGGMYNYASGVKQSEKRPNENRTWYAYSGITLISGSDGSLRRGPSGLPTKVGRVLEDGTSQVQAYQYNAKGQKLRTTDALGRTTVSVYDPNDIDVLEVNVVNGQSLDRVASYTYNDRHQPLTATDASGQTTSYTYTASGQIATVVTPARDGLSQAARTTTYEYYPSNDPVAADRLKKVTGPSTAQGAPTTTYTYDAFGRLRTTTDSEGYTVTQDYDALDRPTRTTYPDGTYEETIYERLDAVRHRDRLGRWSQTSYDALRRVVGTKDPAGRTTRQEYGGGGCVSCGGGNEVTGLVDANGNATRWEYDDQGRRTKEIRANGAEYRYTYDTATGQLKTTTDPKGNVKTNVYNRDGTLAGITYAVAAGTSPTSNVSFTYDPVHNRVSSLTDGTGTTTYTYYPVTSPPTLGAGKLKSVDGPLASDTIEYAYDELGRIRTRQIGSSANTQTQQFDSEGRLTTLTNPLGPFTYTYDGVSGRPTTLTYPNGQTTTWAYYDNLGDRRLLEIHNKRPGGATLSRFEYTYDKAGNILTWVQQADNDPPKVYHLGYDPADQLTAAILKSTDPVPQILKRYYYAYDSAGNRTAEQIDDAVMGATHNIMNQLVSQQAGGALVFKGTVSEPASVTVGGKPASVTADNRFEGQAVVPSGTGQVVVAATDASGNLRTNTYEVSQGATCKTFTYDLNGNMTSDGTRTYEWDAENRLVAVKEGANTVASYSYDYRGIRRSRFAAGVTTQYLIEGSDVVEERSAASGVRKHLHGPGFDNVLGMLDAAGASNYLTRDHLGSIREQTDSAGTLVLRRDYDPWGGPAVGTNLSGWSFAGRENEPDTALLYARARYLDTRAGRFISADPLGISGGLNAYSYVRNRPVLWTDPSGLRPYVDKYKSIDCAAITALSEIWQRSAAEGIEYAGTIYANADGKTFSYTQAWRGGNGESDNHFFTFNQDPASLAFKRIGVGVYHSHHGGVNKNGEEYAPERFSERDKWNRWGLSQAAGRQILSYVSTPDADMMRLGPGFGEVAHVIPFPYPHFKPEY